MTEPQKILYTIGHSNHSFDDFIALLAQHGVNAIADVRSQPKSWLPHFEQNRLAGALRQKGIEYVFLGNELGARRCEVECYEGDRADYHRISCQPAFQAGLLRVRAGLEKYQVCLMCAEKEPLDCHRTVLVCRYLRDPNVRIQHILEDGQLEDHEVAERRLVKLTRVRPNLFEPDLTEDDLIDLAYDVRGYEIAYRTEPSGARS